METAGIMDHSSWPVENISDPHETNDVLWHHEKKKVVALFLADVHEAAKNHPWCAGNRRFLHQLEEHQEDYKAKNALSKPVVAVEVLRTWRAQSPPGRFLVRQGDSEPPIWKDVGNAKARTYISQALKILSERPPPLSPRRESLTDPESDTTPSTTEASWEDEIHDVGKERKTTAMDAPPRKFRVPRFLKPKKSTRTISEHFQSAQSNGGIIGRWNERDRLASAIRAQVRKGDETEHKVGVVIIKGGMGVGRTALARTLICPRLLDEYETSNYETIPSFFLEGKFEYLGSPSPYKLFRDIFTSFCCQLLRQANDCMIQRYRNAITESLQNDVSDLISLVPAFGEVLRGRQDNSEAANPDHKTRGSSVSGSSALVRHKVTSLFVALVRGIASVELEKPLVIFCDDLHWAEETSLGILTSLVSDIGTKVGVLFMASARDDNNCHPNPHFEKMLSRLKANDAISLEVIQLQNLMERDVQYILEDTLQCEQENIESLSALVSSITKGNPSFIRELLRSFQDEGLIRLDPSSEDWVCDVERIEGSYKGMKNVFDMFEKKLLDLPESVQKTLIQGCCLGSSEIDTTIMKLLIATDNDDLELHLKSAVCVGLLCQRDHKFHFKSDSVQHAIYNLLGSDNEKAEHHLRIGQKLWGSLEERKDQEFLFLLLNQLMMGDGLLKQEEDRRSVASLCLRAGERAVKSQGFQTAWTYLDHGIALLSKKRLWSRENYDLSLRLHNAAIEVCYCNANFTRLDELIADILDNARIMDDSLLARSTQIYALGSRNMLTESLQSGLNTLTLLGAKLPAYPSCRRRNVEFRNTERLLRGYSDEGLLRINSLKDQRQLQVMQILNHLFLYAFYSRPNLAAVVAAQMVQISVKFGLCAISSVAFAYYSMFLCGADSIEKGFRYGKLSFKVYDKFKTEAWLCRVWNAFHGAVASWKLPIDTTIEPLQHAYAVGFRTGDIEYAMLCACLICWNNFEIQTLSEVETQIRKYTAVMELSGRTLAIAMLKPLWTFVAGLACGHDAEDPRQNFLNVVGRDCAAAMQASNEAIVVWTRAMTMCTAYLFLDYDTAEDYSRGVNKIYEFQAYCGAGCAMVLFFECLVLLAKARKGLRHQWRVPYVRGRMKLLRKWADKSPMNILAKLYLLQAELAAVRRDYKSACSDYRSAILHARNRRSLSEEALANERLAALLAERGETGQAQEALVEAHRLYSEWGGTSKVMQLKSIHGSLLGC